MRSLVKRKQINPERIHRLDSLRGIAASVVMIQHYLLMRPDYLQLKMSDFAETNLLTIFLNGYVSVLLFFILSGYVLAMPYTKKSEPRYLPFIIRRICRIYLPFMAAILFAALLYDYSVPYYGSEGSFAFRIWWPFEPVTLKMILSHLAMTGSVYDAQLDSIMWSLIPEIRVSFIFPLLVLLCANRGAAIATMILLFFGAPIVAIAFDVNWGLNAPKTILEGFLVTLRFLPFFILGILLHDGNGSIKVWLTGLSRAKFFLLLSMALIACWPAVELVVQGGLMMFSVQKSPVFTQYIMEILLAAACSFFIVVARNVPKSGLLLELPPIQWLGKVSYSLYLLHLPISFFLFRLLIDKWHYQAVIVVSVVATLIATAIFYRWIELPSIRLGKYLSKHVAKDWAKLRW